MFACLQKFDYFSKSDKKKNPTLRWWKIQWKIQWKIESRQFVAVVIVHIRLSFFCIRSFFLEHWWQNVCHIWSMHAIECHSDDMEIYDDHGRKRKALVKTEWRFFQVAKKIKLIELKTAEYNNEIFVDFIKTLLIEFRLIFATLSIPVKRCEWMINIKNFS